MTTIAIREPKALYAALENRETLKQGPIFLEKDGQPTAVLLSIEEYGKLAGRAEREEWVERELAPIKPEIEAYQKMLPELLKEHRGEWVAVHRGKIVALSPDKDRVLRKIIEKQYKPVYFQLIQEGSRIVQMPHLERVRDA